MTRNAYYISLLLVFPIATPADDMTATGESPSTPPSYRILRFDEDYSRLSNTPQRGDWLDPIKYIPLRTDASSWYLSLGGELRERFEGIDNPDFGVKSNRDSFWLQRVTFLADLRLGQRVRFFAEGISGLIAGEELPAPPVQNDPLDLQFAFVDVVPYMTDDERLTLRGGRFGMSLGSGRLVATRASPNIPFKFTGFEMLYSRPFWEATAFLTRPVKENSHGFDSDDNSIVFWGIYLTHWIEASHKLGFDLYYLGIARDHGMYASGTGNEHRHSLGVRAFGRSMRWDWNAEAVVQTGTFGNDSILAWTTSLDAGYTWEARWQPRLGVKVDVTSGDRDSHDGRQETFDALYFKSGYFNDASLLRPSNIIDVHPNIGANFTQSVSVNGGADVFWRYSQNDAIYNPPGFIQLPALNTSPSYVGTALDVNFQWQVQRHVTLLASYLHFLTGSYVHTAGGGDVDYVSTTVDFLF